MACHGVISAGSRRNRLLHQAGDYAAFNFQPLPLRHRDLQPDHLCPRWGNRPVRAQTHTLPQYLSNRTLGGRGLVVSGCVQCATIQMNFR
jgi:hypothetical protein